MKELLTNSVAVWFKEFKVIQLLVAMTVPVSIYWVLIMCQALNILQTLHMVSYLNLITFWDKYYYTNKETKAQGNKLTYTSPEKFFLLTFF